MYLERLALAQQKYPSLFQAGYVDCSVRHDDWCKQLQKGKNCNCNPDVIITTRRGQYSIEPDGTCNPIGAEGMCMPVLLDPRSGALN